MVKVAKETNETETTESDEPRAFAVFDCETAPLADDRLRELCPPFVLASHPGEFDPATVKCGNLGADKKAEKISAARAAHIAACEQYGENVAKAEAEQFEKFKAGAALDATTGRVVAIGWDRGDIAPWIIDCDGDEQAEAAGLAQFWTQVTSCIGRSMPMVGFACHTFDIVFLRQRSWILGVPIPSGVMQGRYPNPLFIDVMKEWVCHQPGKYIKLDTVAKACGLAGKASGQFTLPSGEVVLVDGENFYKAWRRPDCRKLAEEYLLADLRIPAEVAMRMGIV